MNTMSLNSVGGRSISPPGEDDPSQASQNSFEPISFRPKRAITGDWELVKFDGKRTTNGYILKSIPYNQYLKLNETQAFVWSLMDGSRTVSDLVVEVFLRFHTLSIESTTAFVEQLREKGFLTTPPNAKPSEAQPLKNKGLFLVRRLVGFVFQSEFSIPGIDRIISVLFRMLGRVIFSRPVQIFFLLVTLIGVPAFYLVVKQGDLSFFVGAHGMLHIGLATMLAAQILAVFIHEMAHALTTKHFGRQVRRGGVGLYFGMVAFFVDTTDIWMAERKARLAVTWAGPYSGLILGALASITLMIHPISVFFIDNFYSTMPTFYHHVIEPLVTHRSVWAGMMYQFATFCYAISFLNLNPLLKLDGYYILMDWLDIPMLRERSLSFVRHGLWEKWRKREKFSQEERIFSIFGLLALAWTGIAIVSMVALYGEKMLDWLAGLVGEELAWGLLLGAGALLLMIYLWRGLSAVRSRRNQDIDRENFDTDANELTERISRVGLNHVKRDYPGNVRDLKPLK